MCVLASAVDDNHEDCYFVSLGFKVRLRQHKPKTAGGQSADLRSFSFCSSCEPLLHMKQTVPQRYYWNVSLNSERFVLAIRFHACREINTAFY